MLKALRKALLTLLVIVLLLSAVILYRTLAFTSRQVTVEAAPPIEIDSQAAAQRLAQAIAYKTLSHQDIQDFDAQTFAAFHTFLLRQFPSLHATLTRETVGQHSLLYTWQGTDPTLDPILLLAHMDVVPIAPGTESDWEHPPFAATVEDGTIWGRGALDDKGSLMAILEAVEGLTAQGIEPRRTVYLSFGHDEEVGGAGARAAAEVLRSRGIHLEFVLDEGGAIVEGVLPGVDAPQAVIGIAEKGYMSIELTVEAPGGHSSQPPRETAIGILAKAIHRLETHQMPGRLVGPARQMFDYTGPEMGFGMKILLANLWLFEPLLQRQFERDPLMNAFTRTTTAPTIIQAGVKENVLPANARAVVNFRILPGDTPDSVMRHVRRTIEDLRVGVEVLDDPRAPSEVSPVDHPAYRLIERSIREVLPTAIVAPTLVLGGTDSRYFGAVTGNIYRFSPMRAGPRELATIHGTNERITVENYTFMVRFYRRLLENAAG